MRFRSSCLRPRIETSPRSAWSGRRCACRSGTSSASPAITPTRTCRICSTRTLGSGLAGRTASPLIWFWPDTRQGLARGLYPQLELEAAPKGVIFLGPVSQRQLLILYKQAEALVFASLYEGFGLPPLEAMAIGHAGHRDADFGHAGGLRRRRALRRRPVGGGALPRHGARRLRPGAARRAPCAGL